MARSDQLHLHAPDEHDHDQPETEPGGRLPDEPDRAFHAWCIYRDLGARRSLDAVGRRLQNQSEDKGGPRENNQTARRARTRRIQEWSRQWRWVERAKAWDEHVDREARLTQIEAVREMNRRHVQVARAGLMKVIQAIQKLNPDGMDAQDIARLMDLTTRLERLALGQATENIRQEVKQDSVLTLEVVERIVPVRGERSPVETRVELPVATGAAEDAEIEVTGEDELDEIVDDGTGEPPDFQLPDEPMEPRRSR